jgi:hypothetical protein
MEDLKSRHKERREEGRRKDCVIVKYEVKTVKKETRRQRVEGRHGPRKERGKKEERWKKVGRIY